MPALNPAPLSTGVVPDSGVGPAADSVHAVATAVPPLSFTTSLRRCSCAGTSSLVIVHVADSVEPTVMLLPDWVPPTHDQLLAVYPAGPDSDNA